MQTAADLHRAGNGQFAHLEQETVDDAGRRIMEIELDPPIEANGKTYAALHLEEPTGRMIERAESELASAVNMHTLRKYQFALVSLCSGVPRAAIEQMRISQIEQAADFLSTFTGGGRITGAT